MRIQVILLLHIFFSLLRSTGVEELIPGVASIRDGYLFVRTELDEENGSELTVFGWFLLPSLPKEPVPLISIRFPLVGPSGGPAVLFWLEASLLTDGDDSTLLTIRYTSSTATSGVSESSLRFPLSSQRWYFLSAGIDLGGKRGLVSVTIPDEGQFPRWTAPLTLDFSLHRYWRVSLFEAGCRFAVEAGEAAKAETLRRCPALLVASWGLAKEYFEDPSRLFLLAPAESSKAEVRIIFHLLPGASLVSKDPLQLAVPLEGVPPSIDKRGFAVFSGRSRAVIAATTSTSPAEQLSAITFFFVFTYQESLPDDLLFFSQGPPASPSLEIRLVRNGTKRLPAISLGPNFTYRPQAADFIEPGQLIKLAISLIQLENVFFVIIHNVETRETYTSRAVGEAPVQTGNFAFFGGNEDWIGNITLVQFSLVPNAVGVAYNSMKGVLRENSTDSCALRSGYAKGKDSCVQCRRGVLIGGIEDNCVDSCAANQFETLKICIDCPAKGCQTLPNNYTTTPIDIPIATAIDTPISPNPLNPSTGQRATPPTFDGESVHSYRLGEAAFSLWVIGVVVGVIGCIAYPLFDPFVGHKVFQSFLFFQFYSLWILFDSDLPMALTQFLRASFQRSIRWHRIFINSSGALSPIGFYHWNREGVVPPFFVSHGFVFLIYATTIILSVCSLIIRRSSLLSSTDQRGILPFIKRRMVQVLAVSPLIVLLSFSIESAALSVYNLANPSFARAFLGVSTVFSAVFLTFLLLTLALIILFQIRPHRKLKVEYISTGLDINRPLSRFFLPAIVGQGVGFSIVLVVASGSRSTQAGISLALLTGLTLFVFLTRPPRAIFFKAEQMAVLFWLWVLHLVFCVLVFDESARLLSDVTRNQLARFVYIGLFLRVIWDFIILIGIVGIGVRNWWIESRKGLYGDLPERNHRDYDDTKKLDTIMSTPTAPSNPPIGSVANNPLLSVVPNNPFLSTTPNNPLLSVAPTNPLLSVVPTNPLLFVAPTNPLLSVAPTNPLLSVAPTNPLLSVVPTNPLLSVAPTNPLLSSVRGDQFPRSQINPILSRDQLQRKSSPVRPIEKVDFVTGLDSGSEFFPSSSNQYLPKGQFLDLEVIQGQILSPQSEKSDKNPPQSSNNLYYDPVYIPPPSESYTDDTKHFGSRLENLHKIRNLKNQNSNRLP